MDRNIIVYRDGTLVDIDRAIALADLHDDVQIGKNVLNHMGLPLVTDERMPNGMIVLMGTNGEMYVMRGPDAD